MGSEILLSSSIAAAFALIHLIGGRLNFLRVRRSYLLALIGTFWSSAVDSAAYASLLRASA